MGNSPISSSDLINEENSENKNCSVTLTPIDDSEYSSNRGWIFTETGQIRNLHTGDLVLTQNSDQSLRMAPLAGKSGRKDQTWAFKEKTSDKNNWQKSSIQFYRRNAFCWPVSNDGKMNEDYKWPLKGELFTDLTFKNEQNLTDENRDEKRVRVINAHNTAESQWVTIGPDAKIFSAFTSALGLTKPVKRVWVTDTNENCLISSYDEIENQRNVFKLYCSYLLF